MTSEGRRIADFVNEMRCRDLPGAVVEASLRSIADTIGVAMIGTTTPYGHRIADFVLAGPERSESTLIGRGDRVSCAQAALANGTMARAFAFDDLHDEGLFHPGASILAAGLAVAEREDASGGEVVRAVVAGYEIAIRIAVAAGPAHFQRGFNPVGTVNCFGAAVAAGMLLGLTQEQWDHALGLAGDQAASLRRFQLTGNYAEGALDGGRAARNGVIAARLAQMGFPGAREAIHGRWGFLRTFSGEGCAEADMEDLGVRFRILETSIKPYPSPRFTHGAIQAAREVYERWHPLPDDIARITLATFEQAVTPCDKPQPQTVDEALWSHQYQIAVVLTHGNLSLSDFAMSCIQTPEIRDLSQKIRVVRDRELDREYPARWPFVLDVEMRDGHRLSVRVDKLLGSPECPLSERMVRDKFDSLVRSRLSISETEHLWHMIRSLPEERNIRRLVRAWAPGGAA